MGIGARVVVRGAPPPSERMLLRLSPTASAEPARLRSASSAGDTMSLGEISLVRGRGR